MPRKPATRRQRRRCRQSQQALRPRHQCPDARSDQCLPLPGTRCLPADHDPGGTRRPQEGRVGNRPQCPPGDTHLDEIVTSVDAAIDQGIQLFGPSRKLASGRLFLQTEAIAGDLPAGIANREGRQPDSGRRHPPATPASGASGNPRLQGHQYAHQGPRTRAAGAGLLQRQGPRRHRPPVHRHARTECRLLGPMHGHDVESRKKDGHTRYRLNGPSLRTVAGQPVPLPGGGETACRPSSASSPRRRPRSRR
jgi:hypothetical protein